MVNTRGLPGLLDAALREPSRPLVTFYDDASGERVELSAKTFGNWVAKTANLLVDGLDARPGERVSLALPQHWQTAVWLFAAWSAGLECDVTGGDGDIAALTEDGLAGPLPEARDVVGLSLHALGAPLRSVPAGVVDYAAEVRSYGDVFHPYEAADPDAPALTVSETPDIGDVSKITMTGAGLVERGRKAAATWGLDARSRVLVDMPFATLSGLLAGLIAPLCAGGSVIICRNIDKGVLDRRVTVEHVTSVAGVPDWNPSTGTVHRLA